MFTLAHLSDPHLAPLPAVSARDLCNKRILGYLSWKVKRHKIHDASVLDALADDLARISPDHTVITGDITNIGLPEEFTRGRQWLDSIGHPENVTVVPGNHDAYTAVHWAESLAHWAPYMSGHRNEGPTEHEPTSHADFPFVRYRGPLALIGLSSACPAAPLLATGTLGQGQIARLRDTLRALADSDRVHVLLIHHPPTADGTHHRKRLTDAAELAETLDGHRIDVILHGHTHRQDFRVVPARPTPTTVLSAASASAAHAHGRKSAARYNLLRIKDWAGARQISVETRALIAPGGTFETIDERPLTEA